MTIKGKAYIVGIYEHPTRHAPDKSTAQLHAEIAKGAIEDAGLTKADIDGYFCAGDAPGGVMAMVDYLGLKVRHFDSTDTGGCSYLVHLGHAAEAIAAGKCSIALVTLAGKPLTGLRFTAKLPPALRHVSRSVLRLGSPGTRLGSDILVPALSTRSSTRGSYTAATRLG